MNDYWMTQVGGCLRYSILSRMWLPISAVLYFNVSPARSFESFQCSRYPDIISISFCFFFLLPIIAVQFTSFPLHTRRAGGQDQQRQTSMRSTTFSSPCSNSSSRTVPRKEICERGGYEQWQKAKQERGRKTLLDTLARKRGSSTTQLKL